MRQQQLDRFCGQCGYDFSGDVGARFCPNCHTPRAFSGNTTTYVHVPTIPAPTPTVYPPIAVTRTKKTRRARGSMVLFILLFGLLWLYQIWIGVPFTFFDYFAPIAFFVCLAVEIGLWINSFLKGKFKPMNERLKVPLIIALTLTILSDVLLLGSL